MEFKDARAKTAESAYIPICICCIYYGQYWPYLTYVIMMLMYLFLTRAPALLDPTETRGAARHPDARRRRPNGELCAPDVMVDGSSAAWVVDVSIHSEAVGQCMGSSNVVD